MPPVPDRIARQTLRAQVDHGIAELVGDPDRDQGWTLLIDGTAQSHVDLADPTHLEFEYVRRIGHLLDVLAPAGEPLRAAHLGGGAWTLPRYLAATRPRSRQQVIELDGALARLIAARLPADDQGIEVVVGDGRAALTRVRPGSLDVLVIDAFAGARIPAHLTTVEFLSTAAATLDAGGVYTANLADSGRLEFAKAQLASAAVVFPEVAAVIAPDVRYGRRFGNVVLVAAAAPLPVAELARRVAADPFPARVLAGDELARFVGGARPTRDRTSTPSPLPPPGFFGRPDA